MKVQYYAKVESAEEGGFSVTFPDVPEAITEGDTLEEAIFHAHEALELSLEQRLLDKEIIPEPTKQNGNKFHLITPSAAIQAAILVKKSREGKSIADLARMLETSWASVSRLESPNYAPNLKYLERAARLLGKKLVIEFE